MEVLAGRLRKIAVALTILVAVVELLSLFALFADGPSATIMFIQLGAPLGLLPWYLLYGFAWALADVRVSLKESV
jgi:hypothetical protein